MLIPTGESYTAETGWFIGFPPGGMLLPLLFDSDDALYVGDYLNDSIYRIR